MKKILWIQPIIFAAILLLIACKKEASSGDEVYPLPHWPVIQTMGATQVDSTKAILTGIVNGYGLSTTVIFEYGPTTNYGSTVTASQNPVTGNSITNISADISGLKPDLTYHFRVKAENHLWKNFYGNDMEFTLCSKLPIITTLKATNITSDGATLNGTVNTNGCPTTVTFLLQIRCAKGGLSDLAVYGPVTVTGNSITNINANISRTWNHGGICFALRKFRIMASNICGTTYSNYVAF